MSNMVTAKRVAEKTIETWRDMITSSARMALSYHDTKALLDEVIELMEIATDHGVKRAEGGFVVALNDLLNGEPPSRTDLLGLRDMYKAGK